MNSDMGLVPVPKTEDTNSSTVVLGSYCHHVTQTFLSPSSFNETEQY